MMIDLLFADEMEDAIISGRKCCTTRRSPHGQRGDHFCVRGREYHIIAVILHPLDKIRDNLYIQEGFESPDEFELFWRKTHNGQFVEAKGGFVGGCYVHWFSPLIGWVVS